VNYDCDRNDNINDDDDDDNYNDDNIAAVIITIYLHHHHQLIDSSYPSIYTASKHLVKGIFPVKKIFPDLGGIPHDLSGTYQS